MVRWSALAVFLIVTAAVASVGAAFGPGSWYAGLTKPAWVPPNWLFPVVWTILYVMIAVAGWLVWCARGFGSLFAIWSVGLVANGAWTWLMFGQKQIGLALLDIAVLWLLIGAFVVAAWRVSRAAALLYLPYWVWVTFAAALNFSIWRLNG